MNPIGNFMPVTPSFLPTAMPGNLQESTSQSATGALGQDGFSSNGMFGNGSELTPSWILGGSNAFGQNNNAFFPMQGNQNPFSGNLSGFPSVFIDPVTGFVFQSNENTYRPPGSDNNLPLSTLYNFFNNRQNVPVETLEEPVEPPVEPPKEDPPKVAEPKAVPKKQPVKKPVKTSQPVTTSQPKVTQPVVTEPKVEEPKVVKEEEPKVDKDKNTSGGTDTGTTTTVVPDPKKTTGPVPQPSAQAAPVPPKEEKKEPKKEEKGFFGKVVDKVKSWF